MSTMQHYPKRLTRTGLALVFAWLFLGLAIPQAHATPKFRVSSSHNMFWQVSGSQSITIQHMSSDSETVAIYNYPYKYPGKFTVGATSVSWASWDTSLRTVSVAFASLANDTSRNAVVLSDGHTEDTIYLTGYDTNYIVPPTKDFSLYSHEINLTCFGDTVNAPMLVYNLQSSAITMQASLSDTTHWSLDPSGSFSISGTYPTNRYVWITYHSHGVGYERTLVRFYCASPYVQVDSVWVTVLDSVPAHSYVPAITSVNIGHVSVGDTGCGTFVLSNPTVQAIEIRSVTMSAQNDFFLSGTPSTPFWLQAGDSVTFSACFHPTRYYGFNSANINVNWRDSSGTTGVLGGQIYGYTDPCISAVGRDSITLDDVIAGGYVDASASFIVHNDSALVLQSKYISDSCSLTILSPSLPMTVHSGDTVTIRFRAAPRRSGYFGGDLVFTDGGTCWGMIACEGNATSSTDTGLQLFPAQSELLAMTTSSHVTVDTFWFLNNLTGQVHVTGASLSQGTHFQILGELPHGLPDTLTLNQRFGVIVQFTGDTNGFYHDSLTIEASQNLAPWPPFNLEAFYTKANAGISTNIISSTVGLSIAPNPAEGPIGIRVSNATKASVEIFDLLGNRLAIMPNTLQTTWDAPARNGGFYIVRASGVDQNGNAFTISKRLIFQ
ncbi:MAG: hypothetical protein Q8922_11105 [Bacteroidota bacterium]|nr:hypothetical protein [Bacteroidota bacterium]MDP4233660.1 hypothetical protein [Bacteroidota bacterium]MDP4243080.1 hypothetical protein [Bacteroidota bacterium]MDP4288474.1 hypothetical protein [Bacteroidota bacterium]